MLLTSSLLLAAYLIGAIPFGYLVANAKGVDLFRVGSGNIGATNVGRTLGRRDGILVFILDFLKGAGPVGLTPTLVRQFAPAWADQSTSLNSFRIGVALAALLGHLFPIYLKFRGGKGVATGAGTIFVLVPGPAFVAILVWVATVVTSRMISLGSIAAALALCGARLIAAPFTAESFILTGYCLAGAAIVILKHRANLTRIRQGAENRIEARPMIDYWQRTLHLLALSLWFGSAFFFNLLAAPTIFATFKEVAHAEPSDRTAYVAINTGLDGPRMDQLGNALAGAAVGPVFPLFFGLHAICGVVALITALGWWRAPGSVNRWRVVLIGIALGAVAVGWPISQQVTELRLARFSHDTAVAAAAKADFATWHIYSLGLSLLTLVIVFVVMLLAARLPQRRNFA